MEKCPKCGYTEPPQNTQYRGHIMAQYKNKETGEVGMFNDDREQFEIFAGEGKVAGIWVKVSSVNPIDDTTHSTPPTIPKQEVPVEKAPVIVQPQVQQSTTVPTAENPIPVRVPTNI